MPDSRLDILLLSPYHTGSHRAWAEGLAGHSRHNIEILSLPGRFWKWRMHGGALTLARRFMQTDLRPALVIATDMMDLAAFLALARSRLTGVPVALYMHENQLTYPLPDQGAEGPMRRQRGERDQHYAFVNLSSMLAADAILFNSKYHRESLLAELPRFLRHFPDHNELGSIRALEEKSHVLWVGIEPVAGLDRVKPDLSLPPLVLWNQRWEYDKAPGEFLSALAQVAGDGCDFRVAVCGENFRRRPVEFEHARSALSDRIMHWGWAEREHYVDLLKQAEITASTALHEFFGISIIEAIDAAIFPILPNRLSYPELIDNSFSQACFYDSPDQLRERLSWAIENRAEARDIACQLSASTSRFHWEQIIETYDKAFISLAGC